MNQKIFSQNAYDFEGHNGIVKFEGLPDACPLCHRGQEFGNPYTIRFSQNQSGAYGFLQCRFSNCRAPFIANYRKSHTLSRFILSGTQVPSYIEPSDDIPENIDVISPSYRLIYSQASQAEVEGLDLIAGCGYRKALEFLIKDYSIRLVLDGKEEAEATSKQKETIQIIKSAKLSMVINNYLKMPKVQALASRATWLGNDETHYERKIENGDIQVMKSLMKLVIHFIEAEEEAKRLETEIQPVK